MLVQLIVYGLIAAAAAAAFSGWKHSIYAEGAADQLAKDRPVLESVKKERDDSRESERAREGELAALRSAVEARNRDIEAAAKASADVRAGTTAILARMDAQSRNTQGAVADLRRIVTDPPKGDRNAQCDSADKLAGDALRRLRDGADADRNVNANGSGSATGSGSVPVAGTGDAARATPAR